MADDNAAPGRSTFLAIEPQLYVSDIEAACEYYGERLGFTVAFVYGDPPYYAQVFRDGVQMNLRHVERLPFDSEFRAREEDALSATIIVEDAQQLAAEFEASGALFHQPLRTEEWGTKTIIVADPDGNLVAFAS